MLLNCRCSLACAVAAVISVSVVSASRAQQPFTDNVARAVTPDPVATPTGFSYELGRIRQEETGAHSVYTLQATLPSASKVTGQKVRLIIEDTTSTGTKTRVLSLNAGKHKTVSELCASLRDIFGKYQTLGEKASGQELGKIGDLKYGGEIRFVAESPEHLRYDVLTAGEENHSVQFTSGDVASLVALLGQAEKPAGS